MATLVGRVFAACPPTLRFKADHPGRSGAGPAFNAVQETLGCRL